MLLEQGGTGDDETPDEWFFSIGGVALEHDGGCMPFVPLDGFPGYFDTHFLFPSDMRGIRALNSARAMLREMFTTHDACVITGTISRSHRAARWFIRQLGFVPIGTSELDGPPVVHYALDRTEWLGLQPQRSVESEVS